MNWISYFKIWQTHICQAHHWQTISYLWRLLVITSIITACSDKSIEVKARIGEQAPPFTLKLLNGKTVTVGKQLNNESETPVNNPGKAANKAVVLTFMSSWCPCSKDSIPLLKQARKRFSKDDIDFYMIGIQDSKTKFQKFVEKNNLSFPAAYENGEWIAGTYGINAPPTTVFIDKEGKLQRIFYGNIKDLDKELFQWFEEIL